ncbi:hypothetical protein BBP40_001420, partial [Aspergillus hancockii]
MNYCPERPRVNTCTLKITITPRFITEGADRLSIQQVLQNPSCAAYRPLFLFETSYGNVPARPFTKSSITAFDAAGSLHLYLYFTKSKPRYPRPRMACGPQHCPETSPAVHRIPPESRHHDPSKPTCRPTPRPADVKDREYPSTVKRDLSQALEGTRAVWSYGEGPEPVTKDGKPTVVTNSVFMVGPIKSYVSPALRSPGGANMYWLEELPANLNRLKQYNAVQFPKMAGVFQCADAEYRVFIRR